MYVCMYVCKELKARNFRGSSGQLIIRWAPPTKSTSK